MLTQVEMISNQSLLQGYAYEPRYTVESELDVYKLRMSWIYIDEYVLK